jgi:hypothetical protein
MEPIVLFLYELNCGRPVACALVNVREGVTANGVPGDYRFASMQFGEAV